LNATETNRTVRVATSAPLRMAAATSAAEGIPMWVREIVLAYPAGRSGPADSGSGGGPLTGARLR
jgi:hypothetical protein